MPKVVFKLLSRGLTVAAMLGVALTTGSAGMAETLIHFNRESQQPQPLPAPPVFRHDKAVMVAEHTRPVTPSKPTAVTPPKNTPPDPRRLAPRSSKNFGTPTARATSGEQAALPFSAPQMESLGTAGAGLAIVVGLFLLCIWLLRRGGPKPTSPLPKEVVAVLGRVPLVGRNFAQLIQIGNKLILVSITPDGVTTPITEVTDPTEVDRLLGICMRNHKHSTTAEFHQVLQQLASEPAKGFLGN